MWPLCKLARVMRGVFFDLDNTLLDRALAFEGYLDELARRLPETFFDEAARQEVRALDDRGYRDRPSFCRLMAERFPALGTPARVWEDFAGGLTRAVRPEPAVLELLDRLGERFTLAVVTNGSSQRQREKLRRADLLQRFGHLFISEELGLEKPDPALFRRALERTGLEAGAVLHVGDDPARDVAGARAAGLACCWVAHGRTYPAGPPRPTMTVDRIEELGHLLLAAS